MSVYIGNFEYQMEDSPKASFLGDLFKSDEKKFEDVCGLKPLLKDYSDSTKYNEALAKYNECVLTQKKVNTQKVEETGKQVEGLFNKGKNVLDTLTGKTSANVEYTYSTETAESEKIMGMPKVAFYSILAIIIVIVGFVIYKKTKK